MQNYPTLWGAQMTKKKGKNNRNSFAPLSIAMRISLRHYEWRNPKSLLRQTDFVIMPQIGTQIVCNKAKN